MNARHTILILEDDDDRIRGFNSALSLFQERLEIKVWFDAATMIAESPIFFQSVCLFSLEHDLNPKPGAKQDPGTGLEVAEFLAKHSPICPVLLHTSNYEKSWSMHNALRFADWQADRVGPIGNDWIQSLWVPKVRILLEKAAV